MTAIPANLTAPLSAFAMHEEATTETARRRALRWRAALEALGIVLLLVAIAS